MLDAVWVLVILLVSPDGSLDAHFERFDTRRQCMSKRAELLDGADAAGKRLGVAGYLIDCVSIEVKRA